jgi:hypothetical protein
MSLPNYLRSAIILFAAYLLFSCAPITQPTEPTLTPALREQTVIPTQINSPTQINIPTQTSSPTKQRQVAIEEKADVLTVEASGEAGAYQFSVKIHSPDLGCEQYADWWEVIDEGGELLYRRVLLHSHVDEQPFKRSGGPVAIQPDTIVWVRAHMNTGGYGGAALKGSVEAGFQPVDLSPDFAPELAQTPPLPEGCAF